MEATYRVLRYLKKTPRKGLIFRKFSTKVVKVYSDADWAGSPTDIRSTSGYCTFLWGNLVTWRSKKQLLVARSSAKAEFRALSNGICEGMWLKKLLGELKMENCGPVELMYMIIRLPLVFSKIQFIMIEPNTSGGSSFHKWEDWKQDRWHQICSHTFADCRHSNQGTLSAHLWRYEFQVEHDQPLWSNLRGSDEIEIIWLLSFSLLIRLLSSS